MLYLFLIHEKPALFIDYNSYQTIFFLVVVVVVEKVEPIFDGLVE